jgi:hypothetical protein
MEVCTSRTYFCGSLGSRFFLAAFVVAAAILPFFAAPPFPESFSNDSDDGRLNEVCEKKIWKLFDHEKNVISYIIK